MFGGQLIGLLFSGAAFRGIGIAMPLRLADDPGVWVGAELFHRQIGTEVMGCGFKGLCLWIENEYCFELAVAHFCYFLLGFVLRTFWLACLCRPIRERTARRLAKGGDEVAKQTQGGNNRSERQ